MQTYLQIHTEVSNLLLQKKGFFFLATNIISCIKATNGENIQGE